tara:strand:- start:1151 stop:1597 length:447 start_codon:yes stop_codon:yes gene_type:complete
VDSLLNLIKNINKLTVGNVFFVVFSKTINQKLIIQLNQENQLKYGILEDDKLLPFYSKTSQKKWGKPNTRWTLKDTGDFYDSFDIVEVNEEYAMLYADAMKFDEEGNTTDLTAYGAILGLNEESLAILTDQIKEQITQIVLNEILEVN